MEWLLAGVRSPLCRIVDELHPLLGDDLVALRDTVQKRPGGGAEHPLCDMTGDSMIIERILLPRSAATVALPAWRSAEVVVRTG